MSRVLVKTSNPSWFIDAAEPEGRKVRKGKDDQIFEDLVTAQEALAVLQKAHGSPKPNGDQPETKAEKQETPASAKRVEVRCQWKGKDGDSGKRCPNVRLVKPQDVFQVRFCEEHQEEHRRRVRNEKAKAKRQKAKAERERTGQKTKAGGKTKTAKAA